MKTRWREKELHINEKHKCLAARGGIKQGIQMLVGKYTSQVDDMLIRQVVL